MVEIPMPEPGVGEVLLKVRTCGVVPGRGLFLSACSSKYSRHSKRRCASGNIRTAAGYPNPASRYPGEGQAGTGKNSKGLV